MEGNTHLRKIQYSYDDMQIGQYIIYNKVRNQRNVLSSIRNKNQLIKDNKIVVTRYKSGNKKEGYYDIPGGKI